jgi:uncharacterized protein
VIVYLDSSAIIKRVIDEPDSAALERQLGEWAGTDGPAQTSTLAEVEVSRALRRRLDIELDYTRIRDASDAAFGDLVIHPIDAEIVRTARIIDPPILRSLDALHLATAVLIGADVVVTYDDRLAEAAAAVGLTASAPRA